MARVAVELTALKVDPANANALIPAPSASVTVRNRADNSLATWYPIPDGGTGSQAAIATGDDGRVSGAWVERGAYTATVSGTGITTYTVPFDAAPAGAHAIDSAWLSTDIQTPACAVLTATAFYVAANSSANVTWGAEVIDNSAMWASGTDIVVPAGKGGLWLVAMVAHWGAGSATGQVEFTVEHWRSGGLLRNSGIVGAFSSGADGAGNAGGSPTAVFNANAGDVFRGWLRNLYDASAAFDATINCVRLSHS